MPTPFDLAVVTRRPPHAFGSGEETSNKGFATTDANSTAEQDILGSNTASHYVIMRFDQDCYVAFGNTGMPAATASCFPVKANEVWEWLCVGQRDRFCRVIRAGSTNVNVDYYISDTLPPIGVG